MGRRIEDVIADMPPDMQSAVEARYQELRQEIEGLRELRVITGKAQQEIAETLKIKQPSVSKIEKQADMYISTLRGYVEAVGGRLELTVKLPHRPALRLRQLGDASAGEAVPVAETGWRRRASLAKAKG